MVGQNDLSAGDSRGYSFAHSHAHPHAHQRLRVEIDLLPSEMDENDSERERLIDVPSRDTSSASRDKSSGANCCVSSDLNSRVLSDVDLIAQLKSKSIVSDKNPGLSVATTTPAEANGDKTSEVVFPSVRQLVHRFDDLVKRENSKGNEPASHFVPNVVAKDFNIKVKEIKFRFENMKGKNISPKPSECGEKINTERVVTERRKARTRSLHRKSPLQTVCVLERKCPHIDSILPKSVEGSLTTLRMRPLKSFDMKSLSDTNINRRDASIPILPRLDSGASDLSLEAAFYNLWSRHHDSSGTEEHNQSSLTPASMSPAVSSPSESMDNFQLLRSNSCGLLSLSSEREWRRSVSSDSAVMVEEETKFGPDSLGSLSPSSTGDLFSMEKFHSEDSASDALRRESSISLPNPPAGTPDDEDKGDDVIFRRCSMGRTQRTPSVVISDHSGHSVSFRLAYAPEDFPLSEAHRSTSTPDTYPEGVPFGRRASECAVCSIMGSGDLCTCYHVLGDVFYGSVTQRRLSDCSTCSCLTGSEDEDVEVSLVQPSPPVLRKNSNWRKVRNVVQWTPFIQTYKRHKYPWVQLAGHQGNFKAGYKQGTIMKKLCQAEETAFEEIQKDILKPFVPEYYGIVEGSDEDKYLQLQDLLSNFSSACVMDIKMGVRTYLEEELAKARHKPKLRKDMYEKMIQIDSKAPTEAEHRAKAVTKPRYMVWRETISSTATLGFRIEGIRRGDGTSSKDFKTTRTREQVMTAISGFVEGYTKAVVNYIQRLKEIKSSLEKSKFFKSHELIGSSLLFVHNENQSGVWLIDFAKTVPLPDSVKISHSAPWVEGTHEDGYLIGLDNLIELFECLRRNPPEPKPPPPPPDAQQGVESAGKELPPDDVGHDVTTSRRVESDDPTTEGDTTSGLPPSETGEHSLSSERGMAAPPQKGSSKNGNVSGGIERKVLDERKPD